MSWDPCGAFGGPIQKPSVVASASNDTEENTTQGSSPTSLSNKMNETDATSQSSHTAKDASFVEEIEVESSCLLQYILEDATLCILDGLCCRRTCEDNDSTMEMCGGVRRRLRRRRSERANKQSQICCTVISWGPDDEEDVSVLQDPIVEGSEYVSFNPTCAVPNGANESPAPDAQSMENLATPKHKNTRSTNNHVKSCAYCGITREEANKRMKICSRCRTAYYCSKSCQSEDWYNTHRLTCVPVEK
jgi:hypothetical protein